MRRGSRVAVNAGHVHPQVSDNEHDLRGLQLVNGSTLVVTNLGLKKSADGKRRLSRCIWAQAALQLLKIGLIAYAFFQQERVPQTATAACAFALAAIAAGYHALERGSINLLKAYILCMAIAASLAAYPLYQQGIGEADWSFHQVSPGEKNFASLKQLEGVQDVLNVTVQVLGLGIGANLLKYFTPEKRRL
ncbi:hypothetical protein R1sor_008149 [Riccia sorocarpa]|uniref:Uncharacterized protein n=1 Tax=Riccia sorocarpa TaxID=122646 RepID=A0ABD3HSS3_9MARC